MLNLGDDGCGDLIFKAKQVSYNSESDYKWYGILDTEDTCQCAFGSLELYSKDGLKYGYVKVDDAYYNITDLSGGLNVVSKVNLAPYELQVCGNGSSAEDSIQAPPVGNRDHGDNCIVRVLVIYSDATLTTPGPGRCDTVSEFCSQFHEYFPAKQWYTGNSLDIRLGWYSKN